MRPFVEPLKAQIFVRHIENHLASEDDMRLAGSVLLTHGRRIPEGKVGCKFCERSIDQIFYGERDLQ